MVPESQGDPGSTLAAYERLVAACDRYEADWRADRAVRVEDYVAEMPQADRDALRAELVALDAELRSQRDSPFGTRAAGAPCLGRYRDLGEIGRGGMGAVHRVRDLILHRDLALKVLARGPRGEEAEAERRFIEEAQVVGQLQHPGIPPLHEVGRLPDGRPYFTMKLIKGRTLRDLLKERPDPGTELARFVAVFEQIAQTMAYAHSKRVLHRDLKPSNVMVGAFGEVQVMDWGLVKVLKAGKGEGEPRGERPDAAAAQGGLSVIRTVRAEVPDLDTQAGALLGTPDYIAPEQARGERDEIDERSDVFGLGAILCEILSGQPPYVGRSSDEVRRKAARADLADALARLAGCGAEGELIDLARTCLAPEPLDRPRDAAQVAEAVSAYRAGVAERLRRAELARVEEQARAEQEHQARILTEARVVQERRARRLTAALVASVLALAALAGGSWWWLDRQDRDRTARVARALADARQLRDQARALPPWDTTRWHDAREALKRAEAVLAGGGDAATRRQVNDVLGEIEAAEKDGELLRSLTDIRSAEQDDPDGTLTDAAYAEAFRRRGLDLEHRAPTAAAAAVRARPAAVAVAVAAALDDWAAVLRKQPNEEKRAERLVAVARNADPDRYRDQLRATLLEKDARLQRETWRRLGSDPQAHDQPVQSIVLLARLLATSAPAVATELLRAAQQRFPADVWVNFELAQLLNSGPSPQSVEAIRFYSVARALRPETASPLGSALQLQGKTDEAIAVFRELTQLRPMVALHHTNLGRNLKAKGDTTGAAAAFAAATSAARDRLRLKPDEGVAHFALGVALGDQLDFAGASTEFRATIDRIPNFATVHSNLGLMLRAQGDNAGAIAAYRAALRLRPNDARTHSMLGDTLRAGGDSTGAIAEYRAVLRLKPDDASALGNLVSALIGRRAPEEAEAACRAAIRQKPNFAVAHGHLGWALLERGLLAESLAASRQALRLDPKLYWVHNTVANALSARGDDAGAIAAYREALRLKPDYADALGSLVSVLITKRRAVDDAEAACREALRRKPDFAAAYGNLGWALMERGLPDESLAACRKALQLDPKLRWFHNTLADALSARGDNAGAIAEYREEIRLNPDFVEAHEGLARALRRNGEYDESLAEYRRSRELASKRPGGSQPSAESIREGEQLVALAPRLPAVLKGDDRPADSAERLLLGEMAYATKHYAASAHLYAEALEGDPTLAEAPKSGHRFNAACAAALASAGKGENELPPDEAERARLRRLARNWLRAALVLRRAQLDTGSDAVRCEVCLDLQKWKGDLSLASLRDPAALDQLPEDERQPWRELWVELDELQGRVRRP
jgi:serine/threonine-protein kinase